MADYANRLRRLEAIATPPEVVPPRILREFVDPVQGVTSVLAEGRWFYREAGESAIDFGVRARTSLGWPTQPAEAGRG
jgi:hypothetical protein